MFSYTFFCGTGDTSTVPAAHGNDDRASLLVEGPSLVAIPVRANHGKRQDGGVADA